MTDKPLITPQNVPLWTAAGFIVALVALVVAFTGIYRTNMVLLTTQTQVMMLSKQIAMAKSTAPTTQMGAPAAAAPAQK